HWEIPNCLVPSAQQGAHHRDCENFRRGDDLVAKITPCIENGKSACLECLPTETDLDPPSFMCSGRRTHYADTIREAFAPYYRTTILADETDPNKLHDLKSVLDGYQVYSPIQIDELVRLYLDGADRDRLDPMLDACVADYRERLGEDEQVDFKGKATAFLRTYGFLSSILPYTNANWENLSIFLNCLVPKLPAPVEEDLSKGILEAIDMDSYRIEKQAAIKIQLPDAEAEIEPVPTTGGGYRLEPELDR